MNFPDSFCLFGANHLLGAPNKKTFPGVHHITFLFLLSSSSSSSRFVRVSSASSHCACDDDESATARRGFNCIITHTHHFFSLLLVLLHSFTQYIIITTYKMASQFPNPSVFCKLCEGGTVPTQNLEKVPCATPWQAGWLRISTCGTCKEKHYLCIKCGAYSPRTKWISQHYRTVAAHQCNNAEQIQVDENNGQGERDEQAETISSPDLLVLDDDDSVDGCVLHGEQNTGKVQMEADWLRKISCP